MRLLSNLFFFVVHVDKKVINIAQNQAIDWRNGLCLEGKLDDKTTIVLV